MNSMLTAMRSGISAVGRRMGVSLPLPLRKMLDGIGFCHWLTVPSFQAFVYAMSKAYSCICVHKNVAAFSLLFRFHIISHTDMHQTV